MLIILLHLFLNFEIITGDGKATFNEAELMEKRHQHILKVNAYIDGFQQRIKDKKKLDAQTSKTEKIIEKSSEEKFLNYDYTHIWWTSSDIGGNHENSAETTFLPTPIGHNIIPTGYTRPKDATIHTTKGSILQHIVTSTTPHFPSFITRPSFPDELTYLTTMEPPPFDIGFTPTPVHPQYPDIPPQTQSLSTKFQYPTLEITLPPITFPNTLYPTPPPSKFPTSKPSGPFDYPHYDFSLTPTPIHPQYPDFIYSPHNTKKSSLYTTPFYMLTTLELFVPTHHPVEKDRIWEPAFAYNHPVKVWWTSPTYPGAPSYQTKGSAVLSDIVKRWVKERGYYSSIGYAPPQFFNKKTGRTAFHRVVTTTPVLLAPAPPELSDEEVPLGHAIYGNVTVQSSTGPTTTNKYQYMMAALHESYLVVFLVELTALIALKETEHVRDVIKHSNAIIYYYIDNGDFDWLDWPLSQVAQDLSKYISTNETDAIQSHAKIVYRILLERRQALSDEVNTIIDYAQGLYQPWEGKHLFDAVQEFGDYPHTINEGYWTCNNVMEAFLSPFKRLGDVDLRNNFVDMVNKALTARFPQYEQHPRRFGETEELDGEQTHSTREDSPEEGTKRIKRRSIKTTQKPKRHNHHNPRHRKTNLESTTQSRNSKNRRQYRPRTEYEVPLMRSLKPITSESTIQRRYHIVTSKYHFRHMVVKPTTRHYVNLMTRPTKPMIRYYKERYRSKAIPTEEITLVNKVNYRRKINNDDDKATIEVVGSRQEVEDKTLFYHQMKERFKALHEAKSGKLKAELLRKVVEGSSYSDEEADLKMKLVQALLLRNRSDEVRSGNPKL